MRKDLVVLLVATFLGAAGCGGDGLRRVAVQGKLTAQGSNVREVTVLFMPVENTQGEGGIGTTDAEGNFTLTGSRQGAGGVVPGKYRVRLSRFVNRDGSILPGDAKQAEHPHARESVPPPYSTPESPLEVTVPDTGGPLGIDLPIKILGK